MGCAVGACLGCVVMGVDGTPQRVCREGPVFASDEIAGRRLVVTEETRTPLDRLAIAAGLLGSSVIALGAVVTAFAYSGTQGQVLQPAQPLRLGARRGGRLGAGVRLQRRA